MNKQHFLRAALCCLMLVGAYACRKDYLSDDAQKIDGKLSATEARFLDFGSQRSGDSLSLARNRVRIDLATKNRHEKFIEGLVKAYGYPDWNLGYVCRNIENDVIIQLPLFSDSVTTAIIFSIQHKDIVKYMVLERGDKTLADLKNIRAQDIEMIFATYDLAKFKKVLKSVKLDIRKSFIRSEEAPLLYRELSGPVITAPRDLLYINPAWFYHPLTGQDTEFNDNTTGGGGGGGSSSGGYYSNSSQPIAPEIRDDYDAYPCAKKVLDKFVNFDNFISQQLRDIFKLSSDLHIFFTHGNMEANKDGITSNEKLEPGPNNTLIGQITVIISDDIINTATNEYKAVTYAHEAMHAIMMAAKGVYGEAKAKEMFPIFFEGGNNPQHQEMATNYFDAIRNVIFMVNPDFSQSDATYLAWGGLHNTIEYNNIKHFREDAKKENFDNLVNAVSIREKFNQPDAKGTTCK